MLNRRKQHRGIGDRQQGEEQESLLAASSSSFTLHDDEPTIPTNRINSIIDGPECAVNIGQNQFYPARNNFQTATFRSSSTLTPRRIRGSSPEPHQHHAFFAIDQTSSRPLTNRDQGDNYELNRIASGSHLRIDISAGQSGKQQTDYIEYTRQPGDTLQNLSVKYSCPVATIKRLNNLWSDQEFFGLSKIKLPVGRLRLLADAINEETNKLSTSKISAQTIPATPQNLIGNKTEVPTPFSSQNNNSLGYPNLTRPAAIQKSSSRPSLLDELNSEVQKELTDKITSDSIFKNLDLTIEKARAAAKSYNDNANDIMQTLAQSGNIVDDDEGELGEANRVARREAEILLNDLSDYGLSYNFLVLFMFIVWLVCPLAYVIYLEETHPDFNKAV